MCHLNVHVILNVNAHRLIFSSRHSLSTDTAQTSEICVASKRTESFTVCSFHLEKPILLNEGHRSLSNARIIIFRSLQLFTFVFRQFITLDKPSIVLLHIKESTMIFLPFQKMVSLPILQHWIWYWKGNLIQFKHLQFSVFAGAVLVPFVLSVPTMCV